MTDPLAGMNIEAERAELVRVLTAIEPTWSVIESIIKEKRIIAVEELIQVENAETRGRIKGFDAILAVPSEARAMLKEIDDILSRNAEDADNPLL